MIVLLVGTEAVPALELADRLERAGHHILGPAFAERQTFELIDAIRPDIAVIDDRLHSPGANPLRLARTLKELWSVDSLLVHSRHDGAGGYVVTHGVQPTATLAQLRGIAAALAEDPLDLPAILPLPV